MLLLLRCCVLRYASAAAVAVYVAVAAAASGVGSGASVRTLRQFAPASFGDVLLLPEGGWSSASANAPPSGGFEGRPRCCCHGPAYALLRVALAGAPCVLGRVGGRMAVRKRRRTAPTRSRLRWLTLPGVGLPSRYRGIRHLVGNWFTSYPCQRPSRDRGMPWDRPVSLELV